MQTKAVYVCSCVSVCVLPLADCPLVEMRLCRLVRQQYSPDHLRAATTTLLHVRRITHNLHMTHSE